jgi:thiol-disulfide isomerase/thioredoxin
LHVRLIIAVLTLAVLTAAARADSWVLPPSGYGYATIARCAEPATARLQPNEARYEICTDQMALFKAALEKARTDNRLLIVDFGATWCPWCRSLQAQWRAPALLGHNSGSLDFGKTFQVVEIGISTLQAGRQHDVASGHAVLDQVLAATPGTKLKSVPFLAVIDPNDRGKTLGRSLDDFELANAGRHDSASIRAFLSDAHAYMRAGAAAPSEPGWLRKKFSRVWMRLFGG